MEAKRQTRAVPWSGNAERGPADRFSRGGGYFRARKKKRPCSANPKRSTKRPTEINSRDNTRGANLLTLGKACRGPGHRAALSVRKRLDAVAVVGPRAFVTGGEGGVGFAISEDGGKYAGVIRSVLKVKRKFEK